MQRRVVIAGVGSGVGKTTITIGLMAAFRKRGLSVQGFKCGPDYIDASYHTAVTERVARNLDCWITRKDSVQEIFVKGSVDADISIIEGVMGFYDGKSPLNDVGSTAEISMLLNAPVLLIMNVGAMARSAAAIVKGFQLLNEDVNIAGVIVNQAGSPGHVELVTAAIEQECGIPVVGHLLREEDIAIPERKSGLIPAIERGEMHAFFDKLATLVEENMDIERIYNMAGNVPDITLGQRLLFQDPKRKKVRIAVARDAAFNFYYQENLELLEQEGAELVFFSPLAGEPMPKAVDGLYLGGCLPDEYVACLAENHSLRSDIKHLVETGLPTFAECGGFMYLCESVTTTKGQMFEMAGVIRGVITMKERLTAIGYREVQALHPSILLDKGEKARGHEYHYSTFQASETIDAMYETTGLRGTQSEGFWLPNVVAGFTQLHFASNPTMAKRFVDACSTYKQNR